MSHLNTLHSPGIAKHSETGCIFKLTRHYSKMLFGIVWLASSVCLGLRNTVNENQTFGPPELATLPYIFHLANSLISKLPVIGLIFFQPSENTNYGRELQRTTFQYFLLACCTNAYISTSSFLWVRWTIWVLGETKQFLLNATFELWWYHQILQFSAIYKEVLHYSYRQFYLFFAPLYYQHISPLSVKLFSRDLISQRTEQKRQFWALPLKMTENNRNRSGWYNWPECLLVV